MYGLIKNNFSENQIQILKLLFEKDYLQNNLQDALNTTGANLHYHLTRLKGYNLIRKETIQKIGNARVNKVSINPSARQCIRQILGFEVKDYTLVTGFGALKEGYQLPDRVFKILKEKNYPISRVVCFSSPDAIKKREEHQKEENLMEIDDFFEFSYEDYRNVKSEFFQKVEKILSEEMKTADIIIDLTPLSKLFSLKMLELANKYSLPCIYLGITEKGDNELLSLTNMRIEGIIQQFK